MTHKRPLEAAPPEQEAARSPRKRLRRTVLVMMWLERRRRARAVTVGQMAQMVRQAQLDMAKLFMLLMVLVARLGSMERLLLGLPNLVQRMLEEQFDAFHRSFMGSIEDKIQSAVQTQMQTQQAAVLPNGVYAPTREISGSFPETGSSTGVYKLRFDVKPKDPLYTGCPVQWQNGENAKVAIFGNEKQITEGDLSKLQIEILPVRDDFFTEQGQEEFNIQRYTYKGKESVLKTVNLTNGEACLGSFTFTESSYGKKLRLIARVKRHDIADRVQEAITDPFVVKDRRSESNKKSYPPFKKDAIHQLEKISQKGKRRDNLVDKNITTVKHLMRHYHKDESSLQELTGMKEDWSTMIKHATTCDPGDEIYSYRVAEENLELLFNDFYVLVGMMINGLYVPVSDLDQFPKHKLNKWKKSAYKDFDERENSGDLTHDYLMSNDCPVREVPLNNGAGPSVQPRTTWNCPNDITAQHEFGERHPFLQQNGTSQAEALPNIDADPSKQETPLFSHHNYEQQTLHQGLYPHVPSMPQNGTHHYLTQGNILTDQGSFSAQHTVPSHIFLPFPEDDDLIVGVSLTSQQNGYSSFSTTDAPGTSYHVADVAGTSSDGASLGTSSLNHVQTDIFSELTPFELPELLDLQTRLTDQDFLQANSAEPPNSDSQFHGYEHNGGDH